MFVCGYVYKKNGRWMMRVVVVVMMHGGGREKGRKRGEGCSPRNSSHPSIDCPHNSVCHCLKRFVELFGGGPWCSALAGKTMKGCDEEEGTCLCVCVCMCVWLVVERSDEMVSSNATNRLHVAKCLGSL